MKTRTSRVVVVVAVVAFAGCMTAPTKPVTDLASDVGGEEGPSDLAGEEAVRDIEAVDVADTDSTLDADLTPDTDVDACTPRCGDSECGDDGCGGVCGTCDGGKECRLDRCECVTQAYRSCCGTGVCWFDSCGVAGAKLVECPAGCSGNRCQECTPDCETKACGEDGCGGECGGCAQGSCADLLWTRPGACFTGQCQSVGGGPVDCEDGNACTVDDCDARDGCLHRDRPEGWECLTGTCEGAVWTMPRTCAAGQCSGGGETRDCSDGNPCTDDRCEPSGCVNAPNTEPCDDIDPCTTGDVCSAGTCQGVGTLDCSDGNPCTSDECQAGVGCPHAATNEGLACVPAQCASLNLTTASTCRSGECVAGTAESCDDGRACTTDGCNPAGAGACTHTLQAGKCLIGGGCYAAGQNLGKCLECKPSASTSDWTYVQDKACDDGVMCTKLDRCEAGGSGDAGCIGTPYSCDDELACTTDACNGLGGCANALLGGHCKIAGKCYSEGQLNPLNACGVCTTAKSTSEWTPVGDGTACGAGTCNVLNFTAAKSCLSGQCVTGGATQDCNDGLACTTDTCAAATGCGNTLQAGACLIAGACRTSGLVNPADPCQACDAVANPLGWSTVADRTDCGDGQKCYGGECEACRVECADRTCGDDGCGGSCGTCDAAKECRAGACVTTCDVAKCPQLAGYDVSCNAQGRCEYANADTTGWKQYDVWILVPPGSFTMGSPAEEAGEGVQKEKPQHAVTFAKGYLIGKYEVTVAEYEACQSASPGTCTAPLTADYDGEGWGTNSSGNGRTAHPQNGLTWDQAGAVCTWLGGRRPSEAEWEYAATGPTHRKYPWGDTPPPDCSHAVYSPTGGSFRPWGCDSCTSSGCSGTQAVGSMAAGASWSGALDMPGNVWEWVEDWWHSDYSGAPADGSVWVSPTGSDRVIRGGGFNSFYHYLRSSMRANRGPLDRGASVGGRCVRDLPPLACGGTTCPDLAGYTAYCNAQQHCEYANPDTTGWKQWDVWVHVPAGSFTMGSSDAGATPTHTVTFAKGYLMGKYEVTVAQYGACQSASPGTCTAPSTADWDGSGWGTNSSGNGRTTHPQNGLTWEQLGAVCTWLGGRRPSEAEWEYAATGPTHRQYPWGDSPAPDCTHAVFDSDGSGSRPWGCDSCTSSGCSGTKPAGSMPAGASWSGALDMAGNVWEWVEDWWHSDYSGAPTDGSAWVSPSGSSRVLRGGSFHYDASYLRSSFRSYGTPSHRSANFGGRCLRPLP